MKKLALVAGCSAVLALWLFLPIEYFRWSVFATGVGIIFVVAHYYRVEARFMRVCHSFVAMAGISAASGLVIQFSLTAQGGGGAAPNEASGSFEWVQSWGTVVALVLGAAIFGILDYKAEMDRNKRIMLQRLGDDLMGKLEKMAENQDEAVEEYIEDYLERHVADKLASGELSVMDLFPKDDQ